VPNGDSLYSAMALVWVSGLRMVLPAIVMPETPYRQMMPSTCAPPARMGS
jgi:hypothetical protein